MTAEKRKRTILIPLDTEPVSSDNLTFTAILAKYLNASLSGLFVANSRTLEAANLPFAFEINRFSAQERSLHQADLARLNRKSANDVQRLLNDVCQRNKISVTFTTLTGELIESAFAQPASDILFFPRQHNWVSAQWQYQARGQYRAQSPARQRLDQVLVYYDASAQAEEAIKLAQRLCNNHLASRLILLCEGTAPIEVVRALQQLGIRPGVQQVTTSDPLWLRSLYLTESSLVLIPRSKLAGLTPQQLSFLFAHCKGQILLLD
ncbi:hypothetical protein G8764_02880 [Pseudomaricurvus alcaniphilus]|uniref:hypothetical protein n=1 Tax=Pseudomaricurvus alcaniphilus TaxID=1166482 RepID=UPI001407A060|nr:hypothetical protein [Pseudomaricurvus alcaniphilus]NHN36233.1 hypothetical protein [Pseudomaricurvus alcaniphilus]